MKKSKKSVTTQKINSRNRNKNKNRNLQIKAKEREIAKKEKISVVDNSVLENNDNEIKTIIDMPVRDEVVIVPERNVGVEDEDYDSNFVKIDMDESKYKDVSEENNAVSDKFKFVKSEDEIENDDELEEFLEYDNVESVPVKEVVQLERQEIENETRDEDEYVPSSVEHVDINAKKHISFESRIVGLLILIVVSFFIAGLLIFKSITYNSTDAITYDEKSSLEYEICILENSGTQYYANKCLEEGMEYLTSIADRMPVTFEYEMDFSNSVDTEISYYVVSRVNVYKDKNGKVLNTMEDVLVERTIYDVFGKETDFSVDVDIPFKKYTNYVNDYNLQYGIDGYADLEVVFYVDNGNVIKKAASFTAPLSGQTFNVDVVELDNEKQYLSVPNGSLGNVNTSYAVVGVIFVLFGVICIIRLSNLVYKVIGTSSMYQRKLSKILREFDRYIVISRGDYVIDESKRLIKVTTFGELLDARNTLEKPIVYVKVNNVKSEFYVEDSEAIYKYTIKEADFEGK